MINTGDAEFSALASAGFSGSLEDKRYKFWNAAQTSGLQGVGNSRVRLPKLYKAIMNVLSGKGQAFIGVLGDSTTVGAGAGTGGGNLVGAAINSPTAQLSRWLTARGIPASDNSFFGEHLFQAFAPSVSLASYDPRFAYVGGSTYYANGAQQSAGGIMIQLDAAGEGINFTPQVNGVNSNVDTAKIWYCNRYTGTWDSSFAGGASLGTVTGSGALTIGTTTKSFTRGTGTFSITRSAGNNVFIGGCFYDTTSPTVNILNFGNYGDKLSATPNGVATNANEWRGGAAIAAMGLDAVIVDMSINDINTNSLAGLDAYKAALIVLCNDVVGSGADLILATPHSIGTAAQGSVSNAYVEAIYSVAAQFNCPVIDFYNRLTPYSAFSAAFYADTLHLNTQGYRAKSVDYAKVISQSAGV